MTHLTSLLDMADNSDSLERFNIGPSQQEFIEGGVRLRSDEFFHPEELPENWDFVVNNTRFSFGSGKAGNGGMGAVDFAEEYPLCVDPEMQSLIGEYLNEKSFLLNKAGLHPSFREWMDEDFRGIMDSPISAGDKRDFFIYPDEADFDVKTLRRIWGDRDTQVRYLNKNGRHGQDDIVFFTVKEGENNEKTIDEAVFIKVGKFNELLAANNIRQRIIRPDSQNALNNFGKLLKSLHITGEQLASTTIGMIEHKAGEVSVNKDLQAKYASSPETDIPRKSSEPEETLQTNPVKPEEDVKGLKEQTDIGSGDLTQNGEPESEHNGFLLQFGDDQKELERGLGEMFSYPETRVRYVPDKNDSHDDRLVFFTIDNTGKNAVVDKRIEVTVGTFNRILEQSGCGETVKRPEHKREVDELGRLLKKLKIEDNNGGKGEKVSLLSENIGIDPQYLKDEILLAEAKKTDPPITETVHEMSAKKTDTLKTLDKGIFRDLVIDPEDVRFDPHELAKLWGDQGVSVKYLAKDSTDILVVFKPNADNTAVVQKIVIPVELLNRLLQQNNIQVEVTRPHSIEELQSIGQLLATFRIEGKKLSHRQITSNISFAPVVEEKKAFSQNQAIIDLKPDYGSLAEKGIDESPIRNLVEAWETGKVRRVGIMFNNGSVGNFSFLVVQGSEEKVLHIPLATFISAFEGIRRTEIFHKLLNTHTQSLSLATPRGEVLIGSNLPNKQINSVIRNFAIANHQLSGDAIVTIVRKDPTTQAFTRQDFTN